MVEVAAAVVLLFVAGVVGFLAVVAGAIDAFLWLYCSSLPCDRRLPLFNVSFFNSDIRNGSLSSFDPLFNR